METYKVFYESMQSLRKQIKKTIPVKVLAVAYWEHNKTADMRICASCQFEDSDWQILVPACYMGFEIENKDKLTDYDKEQIYKSYIRNMQGAYIDIVVQGVILENKFVGASRVQAMDSIVKQNYFKSDKNGKSKMERCFEQKKPIEARVVTVAKSQVFVDVLGKIVKVFARDVEHRFVNNLKDVICVGQIVPVMITRLAIDKENQLIDIGVSIKDAKEDNTLKNMRNFTPKSEWLGKVTGITRQKGYFVQIGTMNSGIDVLCKYVACSEMPNVGDTVNVKLTMVNSETGRAAGEILEIKNQALLVA